MFRRIGAELVLSGGRHPTTHWIIPTFLDKKEAHSKPEKRLSRFFCEPKQLDINTLPSLPQGCCRIGTKLANALFTKRET